MHCQTFVPRAHKWCGIYARHVQAACEGRDRCEALCRVILDAAIWSRSDCGVHIKARFPGPQVGLVGLPKPCMQIRSTAKNNSKVHKPQLGLLSTLTHTHSCRCSPKILTLLLYGCADSPTPDNAHASLPARHARFPTTVGRDDGNLDVGIRITRPHSPPLAPTHHYLHPPYPNPSHAPLTPTDAPRRAPSTP
jgi:hypothetical protein